MEKDIIFGICADVHQRDIYDATDKIKKFVDEAHERGAKFIIELGDFVLDNEPGRKLLGEWNKFNGPTYHVLGNHDCEHGGKGPTMALTGQPSNYYSFDCGAYHFIVLDTNYFKDGGEYHDYGDNNYHKDFFNCYIPTEQLEWLAADLDATDKRSFIFTHATLAVGDWTIYNIHDFQDVIWRANEKAGFNKVTMCFSGHDHADEHLFKGGVHYMIINSMCHKYIGPKYVDESSHNAEVKAQFDEPLRHIARYKDPLYAFVQLKSNGLIRIIGKQSEYVDYSPLELHWEHYTAPQIAYREFWMNGFCEEK